MTYTIKELSVLAGISTRTLRYYDSLGLLPADRRPENSYRVYGEDDVNRLQQILLYRELGMPLEEIGRILSRPDFNRTSALAEHLENLRRRRSTLDSLIENVEKSLLAQKGEYNMTDEEKFMGMKREMIARNEEQYGGEVRDKFGSDEVEKSNARLMGLSEADFRRSETLSSQLAELLRGAADSGDPAGEPGEKAARLHKEWLTIFWGHYNAQAHRNLAQMYIDDPRFTAYYDNIAPGAAVFLRDAIHAWSELLD